MFLQFELWKQCSVGCKFCYNKGIKFKRDKINSMNFVITKLLDEETDKYDRIGLIAGEIFNGELKTQEEYTLFYKLIDILIDKIKQNKINQVLITTSMIYENLQEILYFCNYLAKYKVLNKFMLCTSYDLLGRFNEHTEKLWNNTMTLIHHLYPELTLHIEMILTQTLLEKVLTKEFNPCNFTKLYNSNVDYIVPFTGYGNIYKSKEEFEKVLPGFFPKRETFFKFLAYVYNNNIFSKEYLNNFLNIALHSDTLYITFDDINFIKIDNRHNNEAKDFIKSTNNIGGYLDSDIHPREDVETFLKMIGE